MKKLILASLTAAMLALPVLAQQAPASAGLTDGEVKKVDKENKKITLKHAEIKNIDMPPMTMVFTVRDATILDKVQAGDKVRFKAENVGGTLIVTEISPAK